jgi:hypothetical protein
MPRSKTSSSSPSSFSSFWDHPVATIEEALSLRKQIERLQKQLTKTLGTTKSAVAEVVMGKRKGRRKMSPATLRKMRAAQQARWAKIKGLSATSGGATKSTASSVSKKKGRGMAPKQRAKIAAAMKARWAAKRKGQDAASAGRKTK